MGEPSIDEEGGRGRAEQKGRVNRDMNSQRATLLSEHLGVGGWRDQRTGTRDAHALMAAILRNSVELFLKRACQ